MKLTKRESEVLSLIAEGHTSQDIGIFLFISKRTADFHIANLYQKLQVHNRISAINKARKVGLLEATP